MIVTYRPPVAEGGVSQLSIGLWHAQICRHRKHLRHAVEARVWKAGKICMSDIACVRRAQDIGFCGMSDMSDIVSGEKHILFFPQNNVRHFRHPTKTDVLGTSDASNARHAYFSAQKNMHV